MQLLDPLVVGCQLPAAADACIYNSEIVMQTASVMSNGKKHIAASVDSTILKVIDELLLTLQVGT